MALKQSNSSGSEAYSNLMKVLSGFPWKRPLRRKELKLEIAGNILLFWADESFARSAQCMRKRSPSNQEKEFRLAEEQTYATFIGFSENTGNGSVSAKH